MANPRSKARIEARILERVAYSIEFELNDPRAGFITVTRTEVSTDLSSARVYYTVLGSTGDRSRSAHMLESAKGFIRKQLGRVLRTRRIPQLTWVYDDSVEEAERVEEAIRKAIAHDEEVSGKSLPSDSQTPAESAACGDAATDKAQDGGSQDGGSQDGGSQDSGTKDSEVDGA